MNEQCMWKPGHMVTRHKKSTPTGNADTKNVYDPCKSICNENSQAHKKRRYMYKYMYTIFKNNLIYM